MAAHNGISREQQHYSGTECSAHGEPLKRRQNKYDYPHARWHKIIALHFLNCSNMGMFKDPLRIFSCRPLRDNLP